MLRILTFCLASLLACAAPALAQPDIPDHAVTAQHDCDTDATLSIAQPALLKFVAVDLPDIDLSVEKCASQSACVIDTRPPSSAPEVAAVEQACKVCAPTADATCLHQPAEQHPSFAWRSTGQRVTLIPSHRPNQCC